MIARKLRNLILGACFAGSVAFLPTVAFADGGVRYSYEKVTIGSTPEWVLVPRPVDGLKGEATSAELRRAFEALRKDKRATYGKSGIAISGSGARANVKVTIDRKVSQYALIIIAETVYTMTELGVGGVEFPGYAKGKLGRDDIPFPSFTLTVPLWKAVGRVDSPSVQVRMPDGSLVPSGDVARRWKSKDRALVDALFGTLDSPDVYTVTSVARILPSLGIDYADEVLPLLKRDEPAVKKAALESLEKARDDAKVLEAVVEFMEKEKSDELARAAAEFLDKAKSAKYSIHREFFLLARGAQAERLIAARELGTVKDSRAKDKLAAVLTDEDAGVAKAAAESLTKLDADDERVAALKNAKVSSAIRLDIARALTSDKTRSARVAGLVYVAENGPDHEGVAAIDTLAALKARSEVESFLASKKSSLRLAAADALVKLGDVDSVSALAAAVKAGQDAAALEDAGYRIMAKQPLSVVLDKTKDRNSLVQRMAFRAAGERAQKENGGARAFSVLESGTKNRDPLIRGAAARAIGTYRNDAAAKILTSLVRDKSSVVRRDVAYGIGELPEGKLADELKKLLGDSDPLVQAAAMDSLAKRGEAFAWEQIEALSSSSNANARASALAAMARLVSRDDAQAVRQVISKLSGGVTDKDLLVRETAVRNLGTFNDDSAVTSIALQLGAEEERLRIASIEALVSTGNKGATQLVANALNDSSRNVRAAAIEALAKMKDSSAKSALQKRAKIEKDAELVAEIQKTLKTL